MGSPASKHEDKEEAAAMEHEILGYELSVCKAASMADISLTSDFFFIGRTDEEISLVCKTGDVPENTLKRDDGWKAFRIRGELDFSLIGILSRISGILAENRIGIFVVSTYNTDYILIKKESFAQAMKVLREQGYTLQEMAHSPAGGEKQVFSGGTS